MLQGAASRARCYLCGHRLLSTASAQLPYSAAAPTSSSSDRLPTWHQSARSKAGLPSTSSNLGSRSRTLQEVSRLSRRSRGFATLVSAPQVEEDDLPEPVLKAGEESALSTLNITAAAEKQLAKIQAKENDPNLALRILVESGGCHGYSTKLQVADAVKDRQEDDYILLAKSSASPPIAGAKTGLLLVDALTLSLIKGSTLDYATELIGSSFRLVDNPQAKGAGCGCGVSWELKI